MAEIRLNGLEVWFYAGSQHLYGPGPLQEVADDASRIAAALDASAEIPVTVRYKGVLTSAEEITRAVAGANDEAQCIGLIVWMHTFSPAKMWIAGLRRLAKPLLHFHTQYGRDIPWRTIDMDFMNLHQTAHGGREFGFLATRMGLRRKVVTGHWESSAPRERIGVWARAAAAWADG